jgi:hypothetical protein
MSRKLIEKPGRWAVKMKKGRAGLRGPIGAYNPHIDNLLSIHFDAVYSVLSFRHDFSRLHQPTYDKSTAGRSYGVGSYGVASRKLL